MTDFKKQIAEVEQSANDIRRALINKNVRMPSCAGLSDYARMIDGLSETGGAIDVDNALSTTSTNPVENRVVTKAINDTNTKLQNHIDNCSTANVEWKQLQTSGTPIATISINDVPQTVYAPTGGSGSTGANGLSIGNIALAKTEIINGITVDTYNVYLTNGSLVGSFQVKSGEKGSQGDPGQKGDKGDSAKLSIKAGISDLDDLCGITNPTIGDCYLYTGGTSNGVESGSLIVYTGGTGNISGMSCPGWTNCGKIQGANGKSVEFLYTVQPRQEHVSEYPKILNYSSGNWEYYTDIAKTEHTTITSTQWNTVNSDVWRYGAYNTASENIIWYNSAQKPYVTVDNGVYTAYDCYAVFRYNDGITPESWSTAFVYMPYVEDGVDGITSEAVFCLSDDNDVESLPSRPDNSWAYDEPQGDDWSDDPHGVTAEHKYEFISRRNINAGTLQPISEWSTPVVFSAYGDTGADGPGCEYIFVVTSNDQITRPEESQNVDDYIPTDVVEGAPAYTKSDITYYWHDNPQTVSEQTPYQFVSMRKKSDGQWGGWSEPSIWSVYSESMVTLDFDNDSIFVGTGNDDVYDGETFEEIVNVFGYYGATKITTFTSLNVDSTIAQVENNYIKIIINKGQNFAKPIMIPVTASFTHEGHVYTVSKTITVVGVAAGVDGENYHIVTNPTVIIGNYNDNDLINWSVTSITVDVNQNWGNTNRTLTSTNYTDQNRKFKLEYKYDNGAYVTLWESGKPDFKNELELERTKLKSGMTIKFKFSELVDGQYFTWDLEDVPVQTNGKNGKDGQNGKDGRNAIPYVFVGKWKTNTYYHCTNTRVDICYTEDSNGTKTYWICTKGHWTTGNPSIEPNYWTLFDGEYQNVATGFLFAETALIENAIVRKLRTADKEARIEITDTTNDIIVYDKLNSIKTRIHGRNISPTITRTEVATNVKWELKKSDIQTFAISKQIVYEYPISTNVTTPSDITIVLNGISILGTLDVQNDDLLFENPTQHFNYKIYLKGNGLDDTIWESRSDTLERKFNQVVFNTSDSNISKQFNGGFDASNLKLGIIIDCNDAADIFDAAGVQISIGILGKAIFDPSDNNYTEIGANGLKCYRGNNGIIITDALFCLKINGELYDVGIDNGKLALNKHK